MKSSTQTEIGRSDEDNLRFYSYRVYGLSSEDKIFGWDENEY